MFVLTCDPVNAFVGRLFSLRANNRSMVFKGGQIGIFGEKIMFFLMKMNTYQCTSLLLMR